MPPKVIDQTAWLPNDATEAEVQLMLRDPMWWLQEKADGVHVLVYRLEPARKGLARTQVLATNKRGERHELPEDFVKALLPLPHGTVLDVERLLTRKLVVLDLLQGLADLRDEPYAVRFKAAARLVEALGDARLELVRTATTADEKAALMAALQAESAEGVIFKRRDALYTAGRPHSGGTMRRVKFSKRADVVVMRRKDDGPDSPHSFEMFVFAAAATVAVGSVSAQRYYEDLKPGEARIAEVEYLYATRDRRLYQPRIKRLRDDKLPKECVIEQLRVGKKFLA